MPEAGNDNDSMQTTAHTSSWKRSGISRVLVNFQFHIIAQIAESTLVVLERISYEHDKFSCHSLKNTNKLVEDVNNEQHALRAK